MLQKLIYFYFALSKRPALKTVGNGRTDSHILNAPGASAPEK